MDEKGLLGQDLKKAGLKVTGPRIKILKIFEQSKQKHLSAEHLHQLLQEQGEEVGLATVYRALSQLEAAGLLMRHHFENEISVFELLPKQHHDHLICIHCDTVKEFYDAALEARQQQICDEAGFKVTDHRLNIYGICADCQAENAAAHTTSSKSSS